MQIQPKPFAPKRGFTVPVAEWIAQEAGHIGPLIAAQAGIAEICIPAAVDALFSAFARGQAHKRAGNAAWLLLFYAVWHQVHIVGRSPKTDVFDLLASS